MRERIWSHDFQDIEQESGKYSDPWEIMNNWGETYGYPSLLSGDHFQSQPRFQAAVQM